MRSSLPRAASNTEDIAQGKAQLLQVLRRSTSRQEWLEAAAGLCIGAHFGDATEYAKAVEEACGFRKLWEIALHALKEMGDRGITRNPSVYIAAIRSCGKSAWRWALSLLGDMHADGMEQGLVSHKAVLKVLEHAGQWQQVLAMLRSMQTKGPSPGLEEYSLAVRVCSKSSRNAEMTEALRANLDAFIYQDQLESCGKDDWQAVLDILNGMAARDLFPDKAVCAAAIQTLERTSCWVEALQLAANSQKKGHSLDGALYGAIVRCCLRDESLEEAITLMQGAMESDLRPDAQTYEALILACTSVGQWKWALFFWKDMLQVHGWQIACVVHEPILKACQVAGEWKWILAILKDIRKASVEPNMKSYEVALSACRQAEQWDWVGQLEHKLAWMQKARTGKTHTRWPVTLAQLQSGASEKQHFCTSLQASADGSWQVALQLLRDLQSRRGQADVLGFNVVISACRRGDEIEKALALMEEMQEEKFDPDSEVYNELLIAVQPDQAKETPAAIRQSWSMTPGSFRIVRSPTRRSSSRKDRRRPSQSTSSGK